ncbi:recombinase family protein [Cyanobacteria bacterium FACHB-63]|nr:recombinase family protein [Cyanobacteria bacterium FACHB-63]
MRIAPYIRLSKRSQATKGAIASHLFQLSKAIGELGGESRPIFDDIPGWVERYWDVEEVPRQELRSNLIFIDVASGRRNDREDFLYVMKLIERGEIDVLVVRQDRFTRDAEMTLKLSKTFEKSSCQLFEILRWRFINFSDPEDWGDFATRGVHAEKESRVTSRRIQYQKEFARSQRQVLTRPPYGFRRSLTGQTEPNPQTWENARFMVQSFFDCGRSGHKATRIIEEKLGVKFTPQGFRVWLLNPALRGHTAYKTRYPDKNGTHPHEEIIFNTHTPLLTEEEMRQIDLALVINKRQRRSVKNFNLYPLSNLLSCGRCGAPCRINTTTDPKRGYRYTNIYCKAHQAGSGCGGEIIDLGKQYGTRLNGRYNRLGTPYTLAETAVVEKLRERASELAQTGMTFVETEIPETAEMLKLKAQIQQYEQMSQSDPDLLPIIKKKREELKNLVRERTVQPALEESRSKLVALAEFAEDWNRLFSEAAPEEKLVMFAEWIESVKCDRDSVEVTLSI